MIARPLWTMVVVASVLVTSLPKAYAADDTAEFLDAMRNRGYFDLALEYLDTVNSSRVASDEFKARVPYERGVTLLGKWRRSSTAERARLAPQIENELNSFAKANPDHPLAGEARMQLGQMMLEAASRTMYTLRQRPPTASREAELRAEAHQGFTAARKAFSDVEASITATLAKFPKTLDPKTQSAEIDRRREFREQLSVVRTLRSFALLESAEALGKDHADFAKLNEQAATEFEDLYERYSAYLLAAQSRVYQGQCYLNLGKLKEASGCFEDVIVGWGESPNARSVVTRAHAYQAVCYITEKKYQDVITKQGAWLAKAQRAEAREPEWVRLKFYVAEAKRLLSTEGDQKESASKKLAGEARELYAGVALIPGEHQREAQERFRELGGAAADSKSAPKNFDEALQAGKEAISALNAARQALQEAGDDEQNTDVIAQQIDEQIRAGTEYLEMALALVDDDTPVAKVNEGRRLLSGLFWQDEQYYRAAVLASFLARRYPEDPSSASAAEVALASYQRLYQQATKDGNPEAGRTEAERLKDLASFITRRWSKHRLADTAFSVLLNFSITERQYNVALDLAKEVEPQRQPYFNARIATAMWEAQLRSLIEEGTSPEQQQLRQQAAQLLKQTFEPLKQDRAAGGVLAASSLYLTQALLDDGDYASAIKVLEDPQGGPLALSKTANPIASRPTYIVEAYKCALRGYVSVVPPQSDKALEAMKHLEEAVAKTDGGGDRLTKVYVGIGQQLQKQIEALKEAGNGDEALRVGKAFVAFLDKLNERGTSDPTIGRWIAQTYYNLAAGLEGDPATEADQKAYYEKARDAFSDLLDKLQDPNVKLATQVQYAQSLRGLGDYEEAMQVFEQILTEKEMMLDMQKAAAYTLQEWGATDPTKFDEAVRGTGPKNDRGKHIIWGWSYLGSVSAQVARQRPEYKDMFYECWLNQARIRYLKAMNQRGDEQTKLLASARGVINTMVQNYSDFLETDLRDDFDSLLKEIQQAEGKRLIGLEELGVEPKSTN